MVRVAPSYAQQFANLIRNVDVSRDEFLLSGRPYHIEKHASGVVLNPKYRGGSLFHDDQDYTITLSEDRKVVVSVQAYWTVADWRLITFGAGLRRDPNNGAQWRLEPNVGNSAMLWSANFNNSDRSEATLLANLDMRDRRSDAADKKLRSLSLGSELDRLGFVSAHGADAKSMLRRFKAGMPVSSLALVGFVDCQGVILDCNNAPTDPEDFLRRWIQGSVLKGHYMKNKGYALP